MAMGGQILPLEPGEDGLSVSEATLVAESQRQAARENSISPAQPNFIEQLDVLLGSTLGQMFIEKLSAPSRPAGLMLKLGDGADAVSLDDYTRLLDLQGRQANGQMLRDSMPALTTLAKDFSSAFQRMSAQEKVDQEVALAEAQGQAQADALADAEAAEAEAARAPRETTCPTCGSRELVPPNLKPWRCQNCGAVHDPMTQVVADQRDVTCPSCGTEQVVSTGGSWMCSLCREVHTEAISA